MQGWGGGGSGRGILIDNGRVNQSKAADALVQVKTTKFDTNVGLNMLLNISSRYFGGLFWSRQLWGLPSSDGYFLYSCLSMGHFEITVVTNSSDLRNYHIRKTRPAWFYCMTTKHTSCDLTSEITS